MKNYIKKYFCPDTRKQGSFSTGVHTNQSPPIYFKLLKKIKAEARETKPHRRTFALNSSNRPMLPVNFFPNRCNIQPAHPQPNNLRCSRMRHPDHHHVHTDLKHRKHLKHRRHRPQIQQINTSRTIRENQI